MADEFKSELIPAPILDPRNEDEILKAMCERAYVASSGRLNDFSPGSPMVALYEGAVQGFAELQWGTLNQVSEAFFIYWLQMLGIKRRLGTHSEVWLEFRLSRTFPTPYTISQGFIVSSGRGIQFETLADLTIPPGLTTRLVKARCRQPGVIGNLPANTIKNPFQPLAFLLSVNNPQPAAGGTNEETLTEAKLRGLASLRRRGLIALIDYEEAVIEQLGQGSVAVALKGNPSVASMAGHSGNCNQLWVYALNADGTPITPVQADTLQKYLQNKSLVNITVKVEPVVLVEVFIKIYAEAATNTSPDQIARNVWFSLKEYINPQKLRQEIRINEVEFYSRKAAGILSVLSASIAIKEAEDETLAISWLSANLALGAAYHLPKLEEIQIHLTLGSEVMQFAVNEDNFI